MCSLYNGYSIIQVSKNTFSEMQWFVLDEYRAACIMDIAYIQVSKNTFSEMQWFVLDEYCAACTMDIAYTQVS